MVKVAVTTLAVVLWHQQVQHHELVALACVLESAMASSLNPQSALPAVNTNRALARLSPHVDALGALHPQDCQIWQAQYRINLGHGITSIELVFRTYKFNEYRRPPLLMKSQCLIFIVTIESA